MKKVIVVTLVAVGCTGCSGVGMGQMFSGENGSFIVAGDEKGGRALFDGLNGLVITGKAPDVGDNAHSELRRHQNQTRALKIKVGGQQK
jgi:hypothetical protein